MASAINARPTVTFPDAKHYRPLAGTKLYCLVAETHVCANNLPKVATEKRNGRGSNPRPLEPQVQRPDHYSLPPLCVILLCIHSAVAFRPSSLALWRRCCNCYRGGGSVFPQVRWRQTRLQRPNAQPSCNQQRSRMLSKTRTRLRRTCKRLTATVAYNKKGIICHLFPFTGTYDSSSKSRNCEISNCRTGPITENLNYQINLSRNIYEMWNTST